MIIDKIGQIHNILSIYTPLEIGILDGIAGNLLFCYEYEKRKPNLDFEGISDKVISLVENLSEMNPSYSSGIAGANWILKYIINDGMFSEEDKPFLVELTNGYDRSLLEYLYQVETKDYSDFLHGEFGILLGIYSGSDFYKNKKFQDYAYNLINVLKINENGYFLAIPDAWEKNADRVINLGLSHGIPSSMTILSKCLEDNITYKEQIIEKIVDFVLHQKQTESPYLYPTVIIDNRNNYPSRLAWCYGDLGIGIAFWQAGKALNREDWKQEAIDIFTHSSKRRDLKENGVKDAGLCHGTAGIAHIFNRMYWETKNPIFKETANYWIEETLKMAKFEDGLVGFKSFYNNQWQNDYSFLEGIAGIGLALLSHISDEEPTWDRCLLLS